MKHQLKSVYDTSVTFVAPFFAGARNVARHSKKELTVAAGLAVFAVAFMSSPVAARQEPSTIPAGPTQPAVVAEAPAPEPVKTEPAKPAAVAAQAPAKAPVKPTTTPKKKTVAKAEATKTPAPAITTSGDVVRTLRVSSTAYNSLPNQTDSTPFITASGKRTRDGIVAANFLPFGTKIRIPEVFGDKVFVVEDRMNKRYKNRVDVWMASYDAAIKYGVRTVTIEVLE